MRKESFFEKNPELKKKLRHHNETFSVRRCRIYRLTILKVTCYDEREKKTCGRSCKACNLRRKIKIDSWLGAEENISDIIENAWNWHSKHTD